MNYWKKNLFFLWISQLFVRSGLSAAMPFIPLFIKYKFNIVEEGKLGVEGVSEEVIMQALANAGVLCESTVEPERPITKTDLYELGFTGGTNSSAKRKALLKYYSFPERLSANSLIKVLNCVTTYERFLEDVKEIEKEMAEC